MNRLLVSLLAAVDALVAVAVGVGIVLAPLTLVWVFGIGGDADWAALWPAAATIWQLGHFAPVAVSLPAELVALAGLPAKGADFAISLAPTALAAVTAFSAWRSGARAARAGAWLTGVLAGTVAVALLSTIIALTGHADVAAVDILPAVAGPALVFAVPALLGALVRAWSDGDDGLVDAVSERLPDDVQNAVDAGVRGVAIAVAGFIGLGAVVLAVLFFVRGGEVIALTQAAQTDLVGVVVLALGSLLYLPTLILWFAGFAVGPGFAIGTGTAVSPAGTSLGVVPGIPVLGVLPDSTSPWLLLLALMVVGMGALAGAVARGSLLIGSRADAEPLRPRVVALSTLALGTGLVVAVLAWAAQGSIGPGRLAHVGPEPWAVALVAAVEVALGAAVVLFSPRGEDSDRDGYRAAADVQRDATAPASAAVTRREPVAPASPDEFPTTPLD
ncbi:DUF6350 family protein [Microbacterium oleivorans]|uniref:cell division protein PerM n=1 Tax=Microbacterium oleivorans TaxID=273677 RepID=UPI00080EC383|nr:DUF6350 family protein [Microbacterium oleivorans]